MTPRPTESQIAEWRALVKNMAAPDTHCTSHPIFVVEETSPKWKHAKFARACLSRAGAEAYIAADGHNLKNPQVYVYSGYRCAEWIALREGFPALLDENAELRRELVDTARVMGETGFLLSRERSRALAAERELDEAREALKPFAAWNDRGFSESIWNREPHNRDDASVLIHREAKEDELKVTVGDFRRAARVLAAPEAKCAQCKDTGWWQNMKYADNPQYGLERCPACSKPAAGGAS